jgi:ribosomal protein S18 acetylase RimI-like enzyme
MKSVSVRPATLADADAIAAFNLAMAQETEGKALDPELLGRGVRAVFAEPARGAYFVAELAPEPADGAARVVGCLLVTREWSDWRNGDFWWIQSVYTAPDARGRGVYTALHTHVVTAARESGAVGVRLYVEPHNARAISTYQHRGMTKTYDVMETPFTRW